MTGTTRVRRIAVDGGESGWESEGAFRRRAAFEVTPHEYDQGQRGASIFEPAHEALKVFAARRYLVGMIPATHTVKLLWTLSLVAATLAVSAASAATSATAAQEALPAPPAQATVDGQQLAVRAMPLVASPMDASAVESLLTDVGLLPVAAAQREAFEKALVAAVAGADLAREAFDAGEYTRVVDAIAAALATGEYPTTAHVAMTRSLRGNALAIDLTLIDAAARAAAFEIASSLERAAPSARFISGRMMRVPQFARDALALPTITTEQAKAVSAALAEWQSADLTSYVAILQGDADLMSAAAAFAKSINPQDSQTWQIGGASPTSHRFAQQDAKRLELVNARRGIAKATREKFEAILGPELWKSIAPGVPARVSARVSTAAKDLT